MVASVRTIGEPASTQEQVVGGPLKGEAGPEFGKRRPWYLRWFLRDYARQPIFDPAEVAALVKFASEQGLDRDGIELVMRLYRNLSVYDADPQSERGQKSAEHILTDYAALTRVTERINGRNLICGRNLFWETKGFMLVTFAIAFVAIAALALTEWAADNPLPDDRWFSDLTLHYIQFFTPFLWGALGSCVYILKRIGDEAAANHFDRDKFQGWGNRALLGAVLGGSVTYIVDPAAFSSVTLSIVAIAFLSGLGTKIVYGALEKLISVLAEKLNLESLRERRHTKNAVSEFLTRELAGTDPKTQGSRYLVLIELLDAHGRGKSSSEPSDA